MKKIKIAQIITRMDWGGSPDIVRVICSYLDPDVYDVTLVTGSVKHPSSKTRDFLEKSGLRIVVIPNLKRDIEPISDLSALIRLFILFRRERFDIVHTHTAKAGVLARIAAFLARKSIIVHTPHGHNFYGYFGPVLSKIIIIIERFISRFTDKIITLTDLEKNDFVRFKVADAKKIRLIYQGLELDRYTRYNVDKVQVRKSFRIEPDESVVGMICRLEPIKGPGYFVEAAKDVAKEFPKTKFIIVGEGNLRKRLERQVREIGLQYRFIFTGWREDMPEILSILDIVVLSSLNEAVGMVLIEAQALGVPIVATRVGGIPEVVKDNQTGILVNAGDSGDLTEAINRLLKDEQKRLDMSKEAKAWVRDRFNAQYMVNENSRLYQELLSNREVVKGES